MYRQCSIPKSKLCSCRLPCMHAQNWGSMHHMGSASVQDQWPAPCTVCRAWCIRSQRYMRCNVIYIRPKPGLTLSTTLAAHTMYAVHERTTNSANTTMCRRPTTQHDVYGPHSMLVLCHMGSHKLNKPTSISHQKTLVQHYCTQPLSLLCEGEVDRVQVKAIDKW